MILTVFVNDSLKALIKSGTITETTSDAGNFDSGLSASDITVLAATADLYIVFPYTRNGNWHFRIIKNTNTYGGVATTSISVTYYYSATIGSII